MTHIMAGLHEIEEKAHDFTRGMNPTTPPQTTLDS